jgi:hypothetical protein
MFSANMACQKQFSCVSRSATLISSSAFTVYSEHYMKSIRTVYMLQVKWRTFYGVERSDTQVTTLFKGLNTLTYGG